MSRAPNRSPGRPYRHRAVTDFSRGIIPIPCHSHYDNQRQVPLYNALEVGCTSLEADVWLCDGDLLVGHTANFLTAGRTLQSVYLEPVLSVLAHQNAAGNESESNSGEDVDSSGISANGIFETNPNALLTLLMDVKSDGLKTPLVIEHHLEPLRKRGWLTRTSNSTLVTGPITIVGSGNTPFGQIQKEEYRNIFYDAPLAAFWGDGVDITSTNRTLFDSQNSFYASASFPKIIERP